MFTSKEIGEPKSNEMASVSGKLSAAAKEAAKKLGTNRVYVMEEADFKVSVEGLPDMFVKGKSSSAVKASLRKVIKKPDAIQSIERVMPSELKKIFRDKAAGKEEIEESLEEVNIIKNGRKFSNVKWFETDKEANNFLEKTKTME